MMNEDEYSVAKLNLAVSIAIALFGALVSIFIAVITTAASTAQSRKALAQADAIASKQFELTHAQIDLEKMLNDLEEWRKQPRLSVLRSSQLGADKMQSTLQNDGGRQLVLFAIANQWLTPANEPKFGSPPSTIGSAIVDTAQRSHVVPIDLSSRRLDIPYTFDPPIVIAPGEVLTLSIKLSPRTRSCHLVIDSNATEPWFVIGTFYHQPEALP